MLVLRTRKLEKSTIHNQMLLKHNAIQRCLNSIERNLKKYHKIINKLKQKIAITKKKKKKKKQTNTRHTANIIQQFTLFRSICPLKAA
jgi:hypothetical protein